MSCRKKCLDKKLLVNLSKSTVLGLGAVAGILGVMSGVGAMTNSPLVAICGTSFSLTWLALDVMAFAYDRNFAEVCQEFADMFDNIHNRVRWVFSSRYRKYCYLTAVRRQEQFEDYEVDGIGGWEDWAVPEQEDENCRINHNCNGEQTYAMQQIARAIKRKQNQDIYPDYDTDYAEMHGDTYDDFDEMDDVIMPKVRQSFFQKTK